MDSTSSTHVGPAADERAWALAAHAGGPLGVMLSAGLLGFVVPLVIWLAKRDESAFVADQGKEALNFQLTLFALHVVGWVFILLTLGLGALIVVPGFILLAIGELVLGLIAALRSYDGRRYRYPLTVRFIA